MYNYFKLAIIAVFLFISVHLTVNADNEFLYGSAANFEVSPVFGDNMIFQQNEPIRIWGTSSYDGEVVNAKLGNSLGYSIVENGTWEITLSARTYSSEPLVLEIFGAPDSKTVSFENIRIGDVWWALGQSNIEYTTSSAPEFESFCSGLDGSENAVVYQLELGSFEKSSSARWRVFNRYSTQSASALASFFTKELCSATNNEIPIAIVSMGFGGHELASFMPPELTKSVSFEKSKNEVYNRVLKNIVRMPIKGMIWYQGEADANIYSDYSLKLKSFIRWLRSKKAQDNEAFPIYAVELAPCFDNPTDEARQYINFGTVRGELCSVSYMLDNFYVCASSDLWSDKDYSNNIHPNNKFALAKRLSLMVLSKEYAFGGEQSFFAPTIKSIRYGKNAKNLDITFNFTGDGLKYDTLSGFCVIGKNWQILEDVVIELTAPDTITVSSSEEICIVRYNTETSNIFKKDISLCNSYGMPAAAFSVNISPPLFPEKLGFNKIIFTYTLFTVMLIACIIILIKKIFRHYHGR